MTDWANPVELRRLNVKFTRTPAGGFVEDVDVVTFHFAKLAAGVPAATWVAADMAAIEARWDTLWTTLKTGRSPRFTLSEYRWYVDGPTQSPADRAAGPPNPSIRTTARSVAGTDNANGDLPPQVAVSVTEVTSLKKRWGRWYAPVGMADSLALDGRISTAKLTTWAAAVVAFYNGVRADGFKPVVWSRERSAYVTGAGLSIGHHDATAYEITRVQIDNTFDIIRSRRWSSPTIRNSTVLT